MLRRKSRLDIILLSPTFNIIVALVAAVLILLFGGGARFLSLFVSLAVAPLFFLIIRSRELFKAPPWVFPPLFILFQAAFRLSPFGLGLLLLAVASFFVVSLNFMKPKHSRVAFTLCLPVGFAALFLPSILLWVPILIGILAGLKAFSLRSFMAIILALITPWILFPGFCLISAHIDLLEQLFARYASLRFSFNPLLGLQYYIPALLALLGALFTFLISYGYPARMRAHNMSFYLLGSGVIIMPMFDPLGVALWLPLINLCAAYFWTHFITIARSGRVIYILLLTASCAGLCVLL